jgi:DNA ligase-1
MKSFKPMLASPANLDALTYPVYASPKLDGIRAAVVGGKLLSRSLKEIPSRFIFDMLSKPMYEGLDGELIVGAPTDKDVYRNTISGVMATDKTPDFTWFVFDQWDHPGFRGERLLAAVAAACMPSNEHVAYLHHELLRSRAEVDLYEAEQVTLGYEGIMLSSTDGKYKFGRATTKGGELLKVKRFEDSEAEVIGVEEEMFNGNDAETNELGRTKRSSAKAGKVGKRTMGALIVRDVKSGVEFNIGTGFTAADRSNWWHWFETQTVNTPKPIVKYKHFPVGTKDKPRHPVFLGMRPEGA